MIHKNIKLAKTEINIVTTKLRSLREDLMKREKTINEMLSDTTLNSSERVGILTVLNSLDLVWHRLDSMETDLVFSMEFLKELEVKNASLQ